MLSILKSLFTPRPVAPTEIQCARKLIAAIDAGGVPLNAAKINEVARNLGLEVSKKALPEQTVQRIREAMQRHRSQ